MYGLSCKEPGLNLDQGAAAQPWARVIIPTGTVIYVIQADITEMESKRKLSRRFRQYLHLPKNI